MVSIVGQGQEDEGLKGHLYLDLIKQETATTAGSGRQVSPEDHFWSTKQRPQDALINFLAIANNMEINTASTELEKNHFRGIIKRIHNIAALEAGDLGQLTDQQRSIAGIIQEEDGTFTVPPHGSAATVAFLTAEIKKTQKHLDRLLKRQQDLADAMIKVIGKPNLDPFLVPQLGTLLRNQDSDLVGHNWQKILRFILRFQINQAFTAVASDSIQDLLSTWNGFKQTRDQLAEQYFLHFDRFVALMEKCTPVNIPENFAISVMPQDLKPAVQKIRDEVRKLEDYGVVTVVNTELIRTTLIRRQHEIRRENRAAEDVKRAEADKRAAAAHAAEALLISPPRAPVPPAGPRSAPTAPATSARTAPPGARMGYHVPGFETLGPRGAAPRNGINGLPTQCGNCQHPAPGFNHYLENCVGPAINGIKPQLPPFPCVRCGVTTHKWHSCPATPAAQTAFAATPRGQTIAAWFRYTVGGRVHAHMSTPHTGFHDPHIFILDDAATMTLVGSGITLQNERTVRGTATGIGAQALDITGQGDLRIADDLTVPALRVPHLTANIISQIQ